MGFPYYDNGYRDIILCIDSYQDQTLCGKICNPFFPHPVPFSNVMQFLLIVESMLDDMRFPQHFCEKRSFARAGSQLPITSSRQYSGTLATFQMRVLYRQNASWQGIVSWKEGGQSEGFRSVLELLLLMHSGLSQSKKASAQKACQAALLSQAAGE